ncbi:hypothetical protein WA588_003460, partial [Blastocystis sp. NMH]
MQYYEINYGFRSPYKVLLEESFIRTGLNLNLPNSLDDLIHSALQDAKAELTISECTRKKFEEYREKSPAHYAYIQSLKCVKCNHTEPLSSFKCTLDIAKHMKDSKEKYVICTEKDLYRQDIRRIPGIPLIYLNRSVLTLDQPSKNSDHFVDSSISNRLGVSDVERKELGIQVKREDRSYNPLVDIHHKKKNPNPLSCKKKKTIAPAPQKAGEKKKTRRSKKKAPTPAPLEAISQ